MDDLTSFICTTFEMAALAADYQVSRDGMKRTVVYNSGLNVYMILMAGAPAVDGDVLSIVYETRSDNE